LGRFIKGIHATPPEAPLLPVEFTIDAEEGGVNGWSASRIALKREKAFGTETSTSLNS